MYRINFVLSLLFCLLFSIETLGANKRALLVGVGEYSDDTVKELKGPPNDLILMQHALMNLYGFRKQDIRVLLNEHATKSNIIRNFNEWLIDGTKQGDIVLFYFSGHGSYVPDGSGCQFCTDNDENDSKDEVLLPYDFSKRLPQSEWINHLIIDDELGMLLNKLSGREVVTILDSCHSGTATRSIGNKTVSVLENTPAVRSKFQVLETDNTITNSQARQIDWSILEEIPDGQVYLTASSDDQTAVEGSLLSDTGEISIGLFTFSLFHAMQNKPNSTYMDLYKDTKKNLKDRLHAAQDPQLQPLGSKIVNNIVFRKSSVPIKPDSQQLSNQINTIPVKPQHDTKLLIKIDYIVGAEKDQNAALKNEISRIPYIKIVDGNYYDRMVRGKYESGIYEFKLINSIGDTINIPPSNSLKQVVNEMGPTLEYSYIVKRLANIANPGSDLHVSISVDDDRRDFRMGENIIYNVECNIDCYVIMLNIDPRGNVHLMFPNKFNQNNFLAGGRQMELPTKEMRNKDFEFKFFPPAGEETVKVLATSEKLDLNTFDLTSFEGVFQTAGGSSLGKTSSARQFTNELSQVIGKSQGGKKGFMWGEDTIVLRSYE